MKKSYISILLLAMVMILAISAVSAADDTDTSDSDLQAVDEAPVEEVALDDVDAVAATDDADVVAVPGDKNFTQLQAEIDESTTGMITLDSNYVRQDGESDIVITKNFNIFGDDSYTINANNKGGIFKINQGSSVLLSKVILINGNGINGGAIYNEGTVNIIGSTLTGNTASCGGAIYNTNIATISGSTLNGNTATDKGGAVYSTGTLVVSEGTNFNDNTATYKGGAIYSEGSVDIKGATFESNNITHRNGIYTDNNGGAAIYNLDGTLTVTDSKFYDNINDYSIGNVTTGVGRDILDGAITTSGTVVINGSDFIGNGGTYGSAITMTSLSGNEDGSIIIDDCRFNSNIGYAGAVYIGGNFNYEILNTWFENNQAIGIGSPNYTSSGGALVIMGSDKKGLIKGTTFKGNKVTDPSATPNGGAVYIQSANVAIDDCTFEDNSADNGGGAVYSQLGSTLDVTESTFKNNNAKSGGAIYAYETTTTLDKTNFTNNTATNGIAGAVYIYGESEITDVTFEDNKALNSAAGALYIAGKSTMDGVDFINNYAKGNGGSIFANSLSSGTTITNANFIENEAGNMGGAIYMQANDEMSISGSNFTDNKAATTGGAIMTQANSTLALDDSNFTRNTAATGNAVYNKGTLALNNNAISKTSEDIYSESGSISPINVTVTINGADSYLYNIEEDLILNATITDVDGNLIDVANFKFKLTSLDGATTEYSGPATYLGEGKYNATFNPVEDLNYIVSVAFDGDDGSVVYNTVTARLVTIKGTFRDLQSKVQYAIGHNEDLNLTYSFAYAPEVDDVSGIDFSKGITIDSALTINGNGFTIDGNNKYRIFFINASDVILNNITFSNGYAGSFSPRALTGGAVYINRDLDNIVIDNCNFTSNKALASGGAIYALSEVSISGSIFTNNAAMNAGAIHFYEGDASTIDDSYFIGNNATGSTGRGGAILAQTKVSISGSNFINNFAKADSGAIYFINTASDSTIIGSNFTGNKAKAYSAIGSAAKVSISGSNFTDNEAQMNGAIFVVSTLDSTIVTTISDCKFVNTADDQGFDVVSSGNLVLDTNTISGDVLIKQGTVSLNKNTIEGIINNSGKITSKVNATVLDNKTILVKEATFILNATYVDDNVNFIYDPNVRFTSNGVEITGIPDYTNHVYSFEYLVTTDEYYYTIGLSNVNESYVNTGVIKTVKGTFTDLQAKINAAILAGEELNLTNDFTYTAGVDDALIYGIVIGSDLIINGNGSIIDANSTARIFNVLDNAKLTLINVTLTKGNATNGSAINSNGDLDLNGVTFTENVAVDCGGAIYTKQGTVIIEGCVFDSNDLTNRADGYNKNYGGAAIYSVGGTLNINNSKFTNNLLNYYPGENGKNRDLITAAVTSSGVTIINNTAFENNSGCYGADINVFKSSQITDPASLTVDNSNFTNSRSYAGGIQINNINYTITNSNFDNGTAYGIGSTGYTASGGAIYARNCNNGIIKDSNFTNCGNTQGGAIDIEQSKSLLIDGCLFENNTVSGAGGAIAIIQSSGDVTITNTDFINNTAGGNAGAVYYLTVSDNKLTISDCEFVDSSSGTNGGAIAALMYPNGSVEIKNSNFTNNAATKGAGAILFYTSGSGNELTISNCNFTDNSAATADAIYTYPNTVTKITDSTFTNNGGAADYAIYNRGTLSLARNTIDNLVYSSGALISTINATFLFEAENNTIPAELYQTVVPYGNLTDDNGNIIYDPSFKITVDSVEYNTTFDEATGKYSANYTISHAGENIVSTNYDATNIIKGIFDVPKANVTVFTVTVDDILDNESATVVIELLGIDSEKLSANVTVILNNTKYTVEVINGTGNKTLAGLTHGQYPVVAMLTNLPNYNDAINSTVFYVKGQSKLTIANVTTAEYGDVIEVIINLTDADGNPLNGTVVINETIQVLVENGIGKFGTIEGSNPDVGEYYFNATYEGNDELFGCSKGFTVNVTVKEIDPDDVKVEIDTINICPDGINVTITAPVDGNYTVTVNGTVTNVEVVDGTGIATITGLEPGIYNATVDIAEDEYSMKTITTDEFEYFMVPEFTVEITGTYPNATVTINGTAGNYHIDIDGFDTINVTVVDEPVTLTVENIAAGNYTASVSFDGHDQYYGGLEYVNFTIDKANANVTVAVSDIVEGEVAVIEVYADSDDIDSVNATVKLIIDGKTYGEVNVVNGSAKVPLAGFEQGSHDVIAVLADNNYNYASASDRFFVKHATNLTVSADAEYVYGEPIEILVSLNATSQGGVFTVSITVGEEGYNVLVENGVGKLTINNKLPVGEYNVTSYFAGDDINNYTEGNLVSFNVTPLKINSSDVTVNFTGHAPDGLTITVTSPVDGNYTVAIGNQTNVTVEVKDGQGVATAHDLEVGNYLATTTIDDPNYTLDKYSLVVYKMVPEFDATITGTYPTATVTINGTAGYYMVYVKDVGFTTINVTEDGAFVSGTIKNITAGNYNATVAYFIGNGTYGYTSKEIPFTVGKAEALNITYDGDLGVMGAGTVNITVAPDATGYVIIDNNGVTKYGELVNGSFTFDIYDLTAGEYTIDVTYYGDDNYNKTSAIKVLDIPKTNVTPEISDVTAEILEGQDATFTVTINNNFATGNVTIFVDGVPTQVVVLDDASANVTISDLKYGTPTIVVQYNGDDNYQGAANATTSIKVYNNVVTNETFFKYFDENGILRDVVPFEELIFKGEFSDLTDYVIINMPITITGEEASLYNMGFSILSDDVVLDNMTLVADTSLGDLIGVYDYEDVVISNMDITYKVNNESSVAIKVYGSSNVGIYNNTIYFESHATTDDIEAMAIAVEDASSVEIDNNDITANLTAVRSNYGIYYKYGTMGIDQVHAVRIAGTSDVDLTDNDIIAIINDGISTGGYDSPTIEAVLVIDSELVLVDNNNINVLDPITPVGTPSFLYGMTLTAVYDAYVSNNEFYLSTDGGIDATGTSYAIQLATCDVDIVRNTIVASNNGPNLGIYVSGVDSYSSFYNEDFTVTIENNDIYITGYANSTNYGSLISGIEACAGQINAFNNTIAVKNVAGYVEGINVQGISYAQTYNPYKPVFDIEDNTIIVKDGDYAVAIINNATSTVINNYLIAHELYGDGAVEANEDAIVEANYPQDLYLIVYAEDIYVNDPVEIFVSTNPLFSGNVSVIFNGESIQVEIIDGEGSTGLLSSVPASTYIVNATYDGNYYFMPDNDYSNFTVSKFESNMTITVGDVVVDQDLEVNISLPFADGNVTILLDDGTQATVKLVDGEGNYTITKDHMTAGNHSITVFLSGNPEYVDVTEIYNFTVEKAENYTFEVNLTVDEINYGENTTINVTLPEDANGMIIVSVDDEIVTYEHVVNGTASVTIPADAFTAGDFNEIEVTYSDDKYGETTKATDIFVNKLPSDLTATADDIELGQNATVVIKLPTYTDGDVYVELLGEVYYPVEWKVIFENLTEGTYTVYVYLEDDSIFEDNMTSVTFNVTKVVIPPEDAFNFTTPENSTSEVISVELPDDATGFLLLDINGTQTHVPLVDGKANVTVPLLPEGTYNATITYTGDDKYSPISTTKELNVTSNVPDNALSIPDSAKSDAPTAYSISLPEDATGYLEVDVDGTKYAAPLNKGSASVTIPALSAGNHNVTVTYTGDGKYSPVVKSTSLNVTAPVFKITNNKNVAAVYSAKATYKVLVTRDGKAVGAGETVTFKYNGKTYTVKTDAKGYATFKPTTKVKVKKYTVTATYKGVTVKNTVTIKHVLKVKNAKIKKSKKVNKIKVKTKKVNGKYLKGKKLTLKIKGKKVKAKTNKKGVATFKLKKKVTKKLKAGKKYKFTVTYGKDKVTKKAKVRK